MKTLTLLRHAKSSWDDPVARDFDRPLNAKGRRAAVMIGRQLKALNLEFDHILASPAVRVIETLDEVWSGYGRTLEPVWDRTLYLASAASLLDLVQALPDAADHVLMVGHNPGLEDLVLDLTLDGELRERVEDKYPTATVAQMTLPIDRWAEARAHSATLVAFIRPRDLDPTLGPDTP
ncbi:SixA phosphatase family protein [Sphingomonas fuzhouensis]|uniref:SixA phosphatase family protein n=1 Tax=Sphingomonas fuzhouensis TaxID=3106033 RepID=UPI002B0032CA|nr:histidine phosphatase family protein [Sphingomonas sp. SGZ-02]